MTKKKKIIIFSIAGFVLVAAAVLITLFCTVWRPKSTQEWLNDFKASLAFDIESKNQRTEKKISILESEEEVAKFYQLVEIKEQDGKEVGHILIEEIYPTLETTEFNVYDEYFFIDSNMYMYRKSGGEEVVTKFTSTWDVFWEIANENIGGAKYEFNEEILADMSLTHKKAFSNLSAKITEAVKNKDNIFVITVENTSSKISQFSIDVKHADLNGSAIYSSENFILRPGETRKIEIYHDKLKNSFSESGDRVCFQLKSSVGTLFDVVGHGFLDFGKEIKLFPQEIRNILDQAKNYIGA